MLDFPPDRIEFVIEMEIHVLAESTAVVIPVRSTISECFQYDVGLNENTTDSKKQPRTRHLVRESAVHYRWISVWLETLVTAAMYRRMIFDASVFPDPDSPGQRSNEMQR